MGLPAEVLSSPLGAMLRPVLEALQRELGQAGSGSGAFGGGGGRGPAAPGGPPPPPASTSFFPDFTQMRPPAPAAEPPTRVANRLFDASNVAPGEGAGAAAGDGGTERDGTEAGPEAAEGQAEGEPRDELESFEVLLKEEFAKAMAEGGVEPNAAAAVAIKRAKARLRG